MEKWPAIKRLWVRNTYSPSPEITGVPEQAPSKAWDVQITEPVSGLKAYTTLSIERYDALVRNACQRPRLAFHQKAYQ